MLLNIRVVFCPNPLDLHHNNRLDWKIESEDGLEVILYR